MIKFVWLIVTIGSGNSICCQESPLYKNLPKGKYAVGYNIITLIDSSRITKPAYNYFGEKETGDLHHKITIHIWYPAENNSKNHPLTYADYCYSHLLRNSGDIIPPDQKTAAINAMRETFQGFFGQITDENWQKLQQARFLARKDAPPVKQKFPLLIGMLRPLSTSVTNELMASNGYLVAMVLSSSFRVPIGYISDVTDMRHAIAYLFKSGMVNVESIGAFGFSGSGFSQVLLAMNDPRIRALADLESALYAESIWDIFSSSDLYNSASLRVPFLHIYGKELGKSDPHFEKFHEKKYADRFHLLLNYSRLHHWDVATEGRASTTVLHVREDKEPGIQASFELAHFYLLNFFNAVLKGSTESQKKLNAKKITVNYHDSLWTFHHYPALPAPPDRAQFEEIINRKGVDSAIAIARKFYSADSAVEFLHENSLNALARQFRSKNKPVEGLALMKLAVELHPQEAWLWNNLADMYDNSGNKLEAIRCSEKVLELLKNFKGSEQSFNNRIRRSSASRLERLKKN
jgi:hypothetical protein